MILANKDEDIKYLNAAVIVKAKEYNINLDSFNTVFLIDNDNIKDKTSDVASSLNVEEWFNNTINCMDISAGCIACDTAQSNYSKCAAGCFTANARCDGCEGQDAVCIQCNTEQSESCNQTTIITCLSCDDGCHWCDGICHGCNSGCQGAQTCQSCNVGEGCTEGCQGGCNTPGCESCNDIYNPCATGYIEACDYTQATFGCVQCNISCQGTDLCGSEHIAKTCGYLQSNDIECVAKHKTENIDVCTVSQQTCSLFFNGQCKTDYTYHKGNASAGDPWTYSCASDYGGTPYTDTNVTCVTDFKFSAGSNVGCIGLYSACSSTFISDGKESCLTNFSYTNDKTTCFFYYTDKINDGKCEKNYTKTDDGNSVYCEYEYSENGWSCPRDYGTTNGALKCNQDFSYDGHTCHLDFVTCAASNDGNTACKSGYDTCTSGYFSNNGDSICISYFDDGDTTCVSYYNASCSSCNDVSNNVCLSCQTGQAQQCNVCYDISNDTNCTSCVAGVAESCTTCVDGNGGCLDCQGCNEGCNNNVSCQGYSAQSGYDVCLGQYTDTTCTQSCYNVYNGQTDCLGCDGCQGCDGCNATCYGCNACNTTCNSCESCNTTCETGESGCTPCYSTCYNCNTSCETCHGTCEGCNQCNTSCDDYGYHCPGEFAACSQSTYYCSGCYQDH